MKFFAINGSPRGARGVTDIILQAFIEGMASEGAVPVTDKRVHYLRDMDIGPCHGDWSCWLKTPGQCYQDDIMNDLYPALQSADLLVVATPVYVDGMTAQTKAFIDRMIPLIDPMIVVRDGHSRHELRPQYRPGGRVVLVSTCGFWEMDNFDCLVGHMKAICKNMGREYAGGVLRPHGPAFAAVLRSGQGDAQSKAEDALEAAGESGRQLVAEGEISPETLERVAQPVASHRQHIQQTNMSFEKAIQRFKGSSR